MTASAIVLVCDRLNPTFLGPYGNAWIETGVLNEWAAESLLFETAISDSLDLTRAYRTLWSGQHAAMASSDKEDQSLIAQLLQTDATTVLVTDDSSVREHRLANSFQEIIECEPVDPTRDAATLDQTGFARLMAQSLHVAESLQQPYLLWIHSAALNTAWDAPYALRQELADEEDPAPPIFVPAPHQVLPENIDPDDLLGLNQAYAAEVFALDQCLGPLWDWAQTQPNLLMALTATRGFPLGEHRLVGGATGALHAESVNIPLMIRYPGQDSSLQFRSQTIAQPELLYQVLAEWFSLSDFECPVSDFAILREPQRAVTVGDTEFGLRTPGWYLRTPAIGESQSDSCPPPELYVKPDDRWEVNNVAALCPDILQAMQADLESFRLATSPKLRAELAPPIEELCRPQS